MVIQEFVSMDGIIDKCDTLGVDDKVIASCCSLSFSRPLPYDEIVKYIQKRREKTAGYKKQLQELLKLKKLVQRSPEWFEARKHVISASDYAMALGKGKFGTQKEFFQKKCNYEPEKKFSMSTLAPLKWGTMFEQVAQDIYASRTGFKMYEFGLILHPNREYLGASPDSINEHGIMVEIKCPFKRKITGEVPFQYFMQVQGQLDACLLEECDYLECEFEETTKLDQDYYEGEVGVILEYPSDDSPSYEYGPLINNIITDTKEKTKSDLETINNWIASQRPGYLIRYWKLVKYNVVRVYKDSEFINNVSDELSVIWDKVKMCRSDKAVYDKKMQSYGSTHSRTSTTKEPPSKYAATGSHTFEPPVAITGYSFI